MSLIKLIPVALLCMAFVYLKWRFRPPQDVIGSYLEDTPDRTRQLIRAAKEQYYRDTWWRGSSE